MIDKLEKSYHVCMTHIEIIDQRLAQHKTSAAPQYSQQQINEMLADRAAQVTSYINERNRLLAIKTEYEKRKTELGLELPTVKELTKSNHQKYWFMNKSCATLGWNPVTNNYEKVQQEKIPSEAKIMRQVSF